MRPKYIVEWGVSGVGWKPSETEINRTLNVIRNRAKDCNAFSITLRKETFEYLKKHITNAVLEDFGDEDDGMLDVAVGIDEASVRAYVDRI